jgi:hypothetical protein
MMRFKIWYFCSYTRVKPWNCFSKISFFENVFYRFYFYLFQENFCRFYVRLLFLFFNLKLSYKCSSFSFKIHITGVLENIFDRCICCITGHHKIPNSSCMWNFTTDCKPCFTSWTEGWRARWWLRYVVACLGQVKSLLVSFSCLFVLINYVLMLYVALNLCHCIYVSHGHYLKRTK